MVAPTAASTGDRAKMAKGLRSCRMRPATLEMANRAKRSTFCQKGASCMRAGVTRLALLAAGELGLHLLVAARLGWRCEWPAHAGAQQAADECAGEPEGATRVLAAAGPRLRCGGGAWSFSRYVRRAHARAPAPQCGQPGDAAPLGVAAQRV